ncbi:MAG: hypothetical protein LBJ02_02190 [Bifidobacteriaceae bacterium]|nr:hypothetical protein [Bifidobacteriaceae bacterium]
MVSRLPKRRRLLKLAVASLAVLVLAGLADCSLRLFGRSEVSCSTVHTTGRAGSMGCRGKGSEVVTVYLPGVLARSRASAEPLLDAWLAIGDVQLVDYLGSRFKDEAVVSAVATVLREDLAGRRTVNIYGESLGCFVAIDSLRDAVEQSGQGALKKVNLVLGDCPSGPATMRQPSWMAALWYPGPVANGLTNALGGMVDLAEYESRGLTGPIYWSWSTMSTPPEEMQPGLDTRHVQQAQRASSQGFPISAFLDEVRYVREGAPSADGLSGIHVTYLANQPSHDTVTRQPSAAQAWTSALAQDGISLETVQLDFPTGHSDYRSWPDDWNRLFKDLFAQNES